MTPPNPVGTSSAWTSQVQRVAAGDPAATRSLLDSLSWAKNYIRFHFRADDVEDAYQEFIVALIGQIRAGALKNPERLRAYANAILRNQTVTRRMQRSRARREHCAIDELEIRDRRPNAEDALGEKELAGIAKRVLEAMPERDRETLTRFYLQEQSAEQIQQQLGMTPTQFRLIKSRAKTHYEELCRAAFGREPGERGLCQNADNHAPVSP
jgi:RNA polymerase sigma-70 factor (ECF subfamily)